MGSVKGGGTLITPSHVLTANHVVVDSRLRKRTPSQVRALLGSNSLSRTNAFPVERIFNHPNYTLSIIRIDSKRGWKVINDFAILELKIPVPFGKTMKPACLPGQPIPNLAGVGVTVTGWGHIVEGEGMVDLLLKTPFPHANALKIISHINCQTNFGSNMVVDESMICTAPNEEIDACRGDSGGPMVVHDIDQNKYTLVRGRVPQKKWKSVVFYHLPLRYPPHNVVFLPESNFFFSVNLKPLLAIFILLDTPKKLYGFFTTLADPPPSRMGQKTILFH